MWTFRVLRERRRRHSGGISLLELVLYIGVATGVLLGIIALLTLLVQSWLRGRARSFVEENARIVTERLRAEVESSGVVLAPQYRGAVLGDQPVGYWRLDETSGGAVDFSGNGLSGTYSAGGITRGVLGATSDGDAAVTFASAMSGSVLISDQPILGIAQGSVEAWIYITSWVNGAAIFNRQTTGSATGGFSLDLSNVNGTMQFRVYSGGAWRTALLSGFTAGMWHHVVGTYDGAKVLLYRNAVSGSPAAWAGVINNPAGPAVYIGRNAAAGGAYFNGRIDDVAVYSRALSGAEIMNHYTQGLGDILTLDRSDLAATVAGSFSGYAWSGGDGSVNPDPYLSSGLGWISFQCAGQADPWDCDQPDDTFDNYGVSRTLDALSGFAMTQDTGFILFNCANSPSANACGDADFRVTVSSDGEYHGWAWGEGTGWISMNCENTDSCTGAAGDWRVYEVSTTTGIELRGWAWSENYGWISMSCVDRGICATSNYRVRRNIAGTATKFAFGTNAFIVSGLGSTPHRLTSANVSVTKCAQRNGYFRVTANTAPARSVVQACFHIAYVGPGSALAPYATEVLTTLLTR